MHAADVICFPVYRPMSGAMNPGTEIDISKVRDWTCHFKLYQLYSRLFYECCHCKAFLGQSFPIESRLEIPSEVMDEMGLHANLCDGVIANVWIERH